MGTKAAGKQPVTKGHLHNILGRHAEPGHHAGDAFAPHIQVIPGVAHHNALARGARGCVQTHHILHRHGKQPVGVVIAQILFVGKRQQVQVLHPPDVAGAEPFFVHAAAEALHPLVGAAHLLAQPAALQGAQFVIGHAFFFGIEVFHAMISFGIQS